MTSALAERAGHMGLGDRLYVQGVGIVYFAERVLFIGRRRATVISAVTKGFMTVAHPFHVPMKLGLHGDGDLASAATPLPLNLNFLGVPGTGYKVDMG